MSIENLRFAEKKYCLNIQSGYMATVTLHCSYGDSGFPVTFYLFDGGTAYALDGASVIVHGTRHDGANFGPFNCSVSENAVTFNLQAEMTAVEGGAIAEFVISRGGTTVGTANFGILVENAVFPNSVSYDTDPSVYQDILKYAQSLASETTTDYVNRIAEAKADYTSKIATEANNRAVADNKNASDISAITNQVDVLSARMDEFSRLPDGSTSGDAELADIRNGADGTTYVNAGTAVREQISDVRKIIEDNANLFNYSMLIKGQAWNGTSNTSRSLAIIPVTSGKKYKITCNKSTYPSGIGGITFIQFNKISIVRTHIGDVTYNNVDIDTEIDILPDAIALGVQFNGSSDITGLDYSGIDLAIYELESETAVDATARSSQELSHNIIDLSDIIIGKNFYGGSDPTRAVAWCPIVPLTNYYLEIPKNNKFFSVSILQRKERASGGNLTNDSLNNASNNRIIKFCSLADAYWICLQFNSSTEITAADFNAYYPFLCEGVNKYSAIDTFVRHGLGWQGKKLVWLGTSIPAAGMNGLYNRHAYPDMVGDYLGAVVYNEAVGSSALHCKHPSYISASNPYGFNNNFEAVSRCITNSLDEMEWIIAHYNDSSVFTINVPSSLSDSDKEFIRSCSWENKLQKYFTADAFPDAWVIDHGHNDYPIPWTENTYTSRDTVTGSQVSGWYKAGVFTSSSESSHIEIDVSNINEVWISGTIGNEYDVYDLFDANDVNIGYYQSPSEQTYSGYFVDTSNASKLCISDPNTLISTISVEKYTYGSMYNSLYSYQGGFDFIVNKIKEYNPRARIIMVGEYEDQKYPNISEYQEIVAKRWDFPLCRLWENLGLSQQLVKVNGVYQTLLKSYIPDNLHPHSDTTGETNKFIAKNIAAWMNTIQ